MSFLSLTFLFISAISFAKPVRFEMKDANQRNQVDFVSQGSLERTTGMSHFIAGYVELDPEAVGETLKGELEIDMRTFETGAEMKNLFIREKLFDTALYPTASAKFVRLLSVSQGRLTDGEPLEAKVETQIKLKGTAKSQTLALKITYFKEGELSRQRLAGNLVRITTAFDLDPAAWNFSVPESMRSLAAKSIQVHAHLIGSDKAAPGIAGLPEGPKPKEKK